ncbi:CsgG/HfaB family protein [Zeaxanthinibacter sp. PT1]|uniref:CsgG/HfaB family protein n=1 Tax=Zeaxanthinibacter TaxID=561554 RepID=UPI00234B1BC7|nr:CsgG/HfaB family protein [Zeaxanthinibacter sp. PT1]MDC6352453.1 CsgG/HfaB family protein [Zeaxanthinibacter sp. PT1]
MIPTKRLGALAAVFLLYSCGAFFNQPLDRTAARVGEASRSTSLLKQLPPAQEPVEVAVYNFSDQTGQYKAIENGSTFSTAVTQGATTILIKALEDSGYFIPIERENLSNLSTERNIIRNTKQEYIKNLNPNEPPLPPLLYAGLLLEGGIVSYDTNIITGGVGARYFGVGASSRYRQDRITIYLRAVSTSNGEILKTVYVSKTILSQALDANYFRFVKFQRLLEAETGITQNEPVQLAVQDAIEKAVYDLVVEGIQKGYWASNQGRDIDQQLVNRYFKEKEEVQSIELYNRIMRKKPANMISAVGGVTLMNGDYAKKNPGYMMRFEYQAGLNKYLSFGPSFSFLELNNGEQFYNQFLQLDVNGRFNVLPDDNFSPYLYGGGGLVLEAGTNKDLETSFPSNFYKVQYGAGIQWDLSENWGMNLFAEHNYMFTDELDHQVQGKRDDAYFNFGLGLNYYFDLGNKNKSKSKAVQQNEN